MSITLSTDSLTFNAAAPWAPAPSNQIVTGTVTGSASGTLYIIVDPTGAPFVSVTNIFVTPPSSGQATIVPASPATVGPGNHQGTIVVRACLNDPSCNTGQLAGSPKTIAVSYNVDPTVDADTVTPRVVDAATAGTVILRGRSLAGANSVTFGGIAGGVTVVSDTEIVASYPPLAAGTYPIALNSGALAFGATLVATAPAGYTATFLPHPAAIGTPAGTTTLEYDAARQALLVAVNNTGQPQLLRYAFSNGSWSSPTQVGVDDLQQVRLSHDGSKLLALRSTLIPSTTSIDELDPVTLITSASTSLPFAVGEGNLALSFALANDGNLLLPTRPPGSGFTHPLIFATTRRVFLSVPILVSDRFSVASGDGSKVFLPNGNLMYNASNATFDTSVAAVTAAFNRPPSADRTGARIQSGVGVFNAALQAIGFAPSGHVAAVINREGTRLYTLDLAGQLHTFDVTAPPTGGGSFPSLVEIGSPIPLAGDIGTNSSPEPALAITPDGTTVFAAGFLGVAVQPTPP